MASYQKESLANIETDLAAFKTCVDSIGTPLNNDQNRSEVRRLRSVIKRRIGDTKGNVKGQRQGVEAQQLSKQLNSYAQRFEVLLNQEKRQHQASISSGTFDSPDGSEVPIMHHQQDQVALSELQARERDAQELAELETDIRDLHVIQKDLGGMVHEQGEITDNIEAQVSTAAVRVTAGNRKLGAASILKSKNRKLQLAIACCIGIPIAIILLIIIIVLAVVLD